MLPEKRNKTKIEAIREYFNQCPLLRGGLLNIDYLESSPLQYSINSQIISNPVVRQYVDGMSLRQYVFNFMSSEIRSPDIIDQIEACGFYEQLEDWITDNNRKHILPDIAGVQRIEVISPGYMFDAEASTALYQIQCRVLYLKED